MTSKKEISLENYIFLGLLIVFFALFASQMGLMNSINTLINTAYSLLIETVLYLTAVCVIMGAISGLLTEFGTVVLIDRLLRPLMKPLYHLPGAASLGIVTTFLSDNPAVLTLAADNYFRSFFKKYQFMSLTNLATAFGMGMVVCTYMMSLVSISGVSYSAAVTIGFIGAVIGSIVSTRIMQYFTIRLYGKDEWMTKEHQVDTKNIERVRPVREGGPAIRALGAMLDGGKTGVDMGLSIIPGVLIICTIVMMLTNGVGESGVYTGSAYEGIGLLPNLATHFSFILTPLFGLSSPQAISVPITALGAAGASLSIVHQLLIKALIGANDIAVFTAMCMCWSGYLSTHVSMMSSLKCTELTGKAILSHTIGGIVAGVSAHWLFVLCSVIGLI